MDAAETSDGHLVVSEEDVPEHLRISLSELHEEEVIGHGSSSVVYKASWLCCEVAVKDILDVQDSGSFKPFPKELEILMRHPHPHVVQLLGFCMKEEKRTVSIVMERMETSLRSVISRRLRASRRHRPFDVSESIDILTKVALGMRFLHSREILHGGLSTGIVLMNVHGEDFEVKIGGFAFSDHANSDSYILRPNYFYNPFPPELTAGEIKYTKAVDVYNFGIICYAALTGFEEGLPPWDECFTRDEIVQAVVSGLRPELTPSDIDHDLMQLVLKCWDAEPERRPSFSVICDTLAGIRAAREHQGLQKQTRSEDSDQRWTTFKDSNDTLTCQEITTILKTLPNHLSIDPADVEWRRPIGEGGYSKVYEVNWLGCTFAVKRFTSLSASLREEVQFLTKLQHPHVARLMGLSIDSNGGWIMMERMETDLQKLIHSSPPFGHSEAREICLKIALGLNFLHSKNVIHRDIKPANVLVHDYLSQSFRGRFDVKITDFGVSHRIGNATAANYAGTGLYRAPEILTAKRDELLAEDQLKKTDIYSFGMTCYEIVTGNVLHEHLSARDVIAKRRPKLPNSLDADLRDLISKCWDDDPEVRPDFSTICQVLAEPRGQVVPRSRVRKIVEFWRRKSLLPFGQCLGWRAADHGETVDPATDV
jgi:serine/threonine protein kinase